MWRCRQWGLWLFLLTCYFGIGRNTCRAADLSEIVQRATVALKSDWGSDPLYACVERDEVQKGEKVIYSDCSQALVV